jgi:hypothetical protein
MQAHASVTHAAGWSLVTCVGTHFRWRQLLDPITEPPPRLARLRSGGDPGTNRRCHQGGEKWIIPGQRVVAALQSPFFE